MGIKKLRKLLLWKLYPNFAILLFYTCAHYCTLHYRACVYNEFLIRKIECSLSVLNYTYYSCIFKTKVISYKLNRTILL